MKKTVLMSAAKKARIALAVMAVCGMSFVGAQEAFAKIHISGNDNTCTDAKDFSTIVGSKNNLTGKDYDGEITKFTVLGSENRVNAFYEYILSEDLAKKNQITVVGTKNNIKGTRNTVVGDNNTVYFNESIVLGQNNSLNPWGLNVNSGKNILIGNDINAQTNDSNIAIGNKMTVTASWNTTIIGNESQSIGASEAVILGSNINAAYGRSVMVGNRTWAHANSVALGYNAVAAVAGAEAFGARSRAEKNFSVAIGYGSLADEENTVSVGSNKERTITESNGTTTTIPTRYRRIVNVADGTKNTDAATFGQIIKAGEYTMTLGTDGKGQVTLQTNAGANGPTIKVDASALAGGSTLTQDDFNNMLNASTKFNDLQAAVGNKANANGDNITTDAGSKWADKLGTGAIAKDDKNLVNGETVYNKIGDTDKLTAADLGSNLSDAVVKVNTKAEAAQTTANSALDKAKANETKIGDLAKLDTAEKGNLVGAVNEVNKKATANETKIGDLTKLKTTEKGNLVGAVNDVYEKADKNAEDIKNVNGRVDELGGRVDTLGGAVSKLDTKVNKVGAGAAALAALHPMDFDPDNKLTFAAGVGNYRGANAAAIGAFYRPNEQVMFSIAGNMGNGENMVNAGVSFALDRPSKTPTTKAALVKTVAAQNEQIAALNETVAEQNEKIARLEAMVEKLVAKQNA